MLKLTGISKVATDARSQVVCLLGFVLTSAEYTLQLIRAEYSIPGVGLENLRIAHLLTEKASTGLRKKAFRKTLPSAKKSYILGPSLFLIAKNTGLGVTPGQ